MKWFKERKQLFKRWQWWVAALVLALPITITILIKVVVICLGSIVKLIEDKLSWIAKWGVGEHA